MALSASIAWQVQSGGNANNGGGFVTGASGTDLSIQDSPEATYTDLVIGNPTTTQLSSSARPFVAADIGNLINITGGVNFTTGRYQINSVSAGVATVDRSVGTAGATGGQGRLGGAVAGLQTALSAMVASNVIYVKHGSLTIGNPGLTGTVGGTLTLPGRIIGYQSSRTDGLQATITATSGTPAVVLALTGNYWFVANLKLDCAGLVQTGHTMGTSGYQVRNCTYSNWTRQGFDGQAADALVQKCWATGGTGGSGMGAGRRGGFCANARVRFKECVVTSSASNGFVSEADALQLDNCIAWNLTQESGSAGHGVHVTGANEIEANNCTFAQLSGSGVFANSANSLQSSHINNCLFASISRYGIESTGTTYSETLAYPYRLQNNAYYSTTLGQRTGVPTGINEVTLTADPFVGLSTGDLDLNNTSGGGASLRSVGIPGTVLGLTSVAGAMDIGALQATVASNDATAGGLSTMTGLFREWTSEFSSTRIADSVVTKYLQSGLEAMNDATGYSYTDDTSTTLVASTQEYAIPSDALELLFVEHNGVRLKKSSIEEWDRAGIAWRSQTSTTPEEFALYGNKLVLYPKPDSAAVAASSTLTIRYVRSPRDIGVYGPELLAPAHFRAVTRYAVAEFSSAHPDSATAQGRAADFRRQWDERDLPSAIDFYRYRGLFRSGVPQDVGGKRK